ncbi:alpha/beta hydrolase [Streptomyces sp. NPDC058442]|uniref:alpha/beta hydrolase n=1 Tax=Streptomyces sp. NPDC058442 TaxID=3346503 RepID=UPI00364E1F35
MPHTAAPTVSWSVEPDRRPGTPLVVALHGRGADEASFAQLAPHLPQEATMAFVRAPLAEGGGYAWFANRGIGRPLPDSLAATAGWLFDWLDTEAAGHTSVSLLGFSGGMAMAGGLLLARPEWFAAAVLLSGTLPWDAGLPEEQGRLTGMPVFWGRDTADQVIPADLVTRTGTWLHEDSGARLEERRYPGQGHGISLPELADASAFLRRAWESEG